MATFLDITGFEQFKSILVFIFILISVYVLLSMKKVFGENAAIHAGLAALSALLVLATPMGVKIVETIAPWFAVIFVFVVLIGMSAKLMGVEGGQITTFFFTLGIIVLIVMVAVTIRNEVVVPGDNATSTDYDRDYSQTSDTLFHPKIIGIILVLLIAVFTIALLVASGF